MPTVVFLGRKQLVRVEARWIGRPAQVVIVEEWDQSVQFASYLVRKCQGALSVALIGYLNGYLVYTSRELLIIVEVIRVTQQLFVCLYVS